MKLIRCCSALASTAVLGVVLAGCDAGSDAAENTPGVTTVAYWDFIDPSQDNPRSQALKANLEAFEEENPDIKIDLSVVAFGDMISRLPQSAAAGEAPDVVKMYTPELQQMVAAGVYSPLPEQAGEVSDWLRPVDSFVNHEGEAIAVPYEYRTCALTYNAKILEEIGASVPSTYDEVVEVAGKASAAGYTGFGTGFSDADNSGVIATFFDCFMSQIGQEMWDDDGNATFDTDKGAEFGTFLANLRDAGALSSNVVSDTYQTVTDGLNNGTVAMAVTGTERVVSIAAVNPDVAWTSLPTASTGDATGTTFSWTLGVGAGSEKVDAAWRFIEYMTGPEAAARMASGGEVPSRAASFEDDFFTSPDAEDVNAIAEYVENNSRPHAYAENYLSLAEGLSQAGQQLYLEGLDGQEYIDAAIGAASH